MTAVFQEPGSGASGDFSFYTSTFGTVVSSTDITLTGNRVIKCTSSEASAAALVTKQNILADVGRRISYRLQIPSGSMPTALLTLMQIRSVSGDAIRLRVRIDGSGVLKLYEGTTGVQFGSDGSTLIADTPYFIGLSFTITSTTVNEFRLYLNGVLDISISNVTLAGTGIGNIQFGWCNNSGDANKTIYLGDVYVDDSSALTSPGLIRVVNRRPATENTNNFDTAIGNARGSTDYNNINEVPYSETNGWQHAAATDVQENYGLETASAGDENLTGATLISRLAWLIGKRGAATAISSVGVGAEGSAANGDITLGAPTGTPANDDIWIAAIHSSDQVAHTFTGWTQIVQGNGGGTTSRISVWYFRYAGSDPNLTVTHTGGQSPIGGIVSFRGCKNSGSPVNVAGTITGGTDGSIEHAAITPTQTGCVLLVLNGSADDNGRTALGGEYVVDFEDSAGGTQNQYETTAGTPDGSISFFHDLDVPASDTGTITVTQAASDPWASVLIALEAQDIIGSPDIMDNGSETAIVLTTTSALYTKITDSASYPSNAAGIGMRSSGSNVGTYLYECGTLIAYISAAASAGLRSHLAFWMGGAGTTASVLAAIAAPARRLGRMLRGLGR